MLTEAACADRQGHFNGANSICSATSCQRPCICDWNHSGGVTSADLHAYLTDFLAGNADVNGDGQTDLSDLNAFLDCFNHPPASCSPGPGPILNPDLIPAVLGTTPAPQGSEQLSDQP